MNSRLECFKQHIYGRKVSVIGMGVSNRPLLKMLSDFGARVTVRDRRTAAQLELPPDYAGRLVTGNDYLEGMCDDYIFRTPGLRFDTPQLVTAQQQGSIITSETELFFRLCPGKIIGVTGSDGKTTVTTLIYELMKAHGYTCHLGGNIGYPLLPMVEKITENDYVVAELSSFQLHTMQQSPHIAVVTNLSPNHLDYHTSYEEYVGAKKNIFLHQTAFDKLVLNYGCADSRALAAEASGKIVYFCGRDIYLKDEFIMHNGEKLLDINIIKIPGMHNVENYMAALAATLELVDKNDIFHVASGFGGVPHRIELVRTLDGVRYYNSSIDSSPNRTINTLKAFDSPIVLIAGGKAKGIPFDSLGRHLLDRVKALVLIGATSDAIERAAADEAERQGIPFTLPVHRAASYYEAVNVARKNAQSGDVVLLSNAGTSFDMFKSFEERGNVFKKLVKELV